ncbi:hypothetical protein Pelo_5930 [Pelomyxa schiedti]|nr:hypothetical protein Pelo_5930 [Pelomyxa schiedti]
MADVHSPGTCSHSSSSCSRSPSPAASASPGKPNTSSGCCFLPTTTGGAANHNHAHAFGGRSMSPVACTTPGSSFAQSGAPSLLPSTHSPPTSPGSPSLSSPASPASTDVVRDIIRSNENRIQSLENELNRVRSSIVEREKELACHMLLSHLLDTCQPVMQNCGTVETWKSLSEILALLPPAWQYPEVCCARLSWNGTTITTENFKQSPWFQSSDIVTYSPDCVKQKSGSIEVFYTELRPLIYPKTSTDTVTPGKLSPSTPQNPSAKAELSPFMVEEQNLLNVVTERVGKFLSQVTVQQRIARLSGLLPMCACCNRVEDTATSSSADSMEEGSLWLSLEEYLHRHSHVDFQRCLCPQCTDRLYATALESTTPTSNNTAQSTTSTNSNPTDITGLIFPQPTPQPHPQHQTQQLALY